MKQHSLHSLMSEGLEEDIRRINPWWQGESSINVPPFKRWAFDLVLERITGGMAPIVALKGSRQVGKTTILNQTIQALPDSGIPPACIFRIQFDKLPPLRKLSQPILELAWWYSNTILRKSFHKAASEGSKVFFFFDEIQNLSDWAPQVKYLVDLQPVRGMVTGSSSLRIEAGRDSLAGRIQTVDMGTLLLREIQRMVQEPVSWRQVLSSLKLLDGTLLMKLIEPLHLRLRRLLGNYKVCLCDHALRATWLPELVPLSASGLVKSPHLSDIAGRIAESAAGYFLSSISSIDIAHFPERDAEPEVDFVLTVGDQRIPSTGAGRTIRTQRELPLNF